MDFSVEKYDNLWNEHYENINNAYVCVSSNKCSEISEFIHSLLKELEEMYNFDWNDEVSETFKSNVLVCYRAFENIKTSIDEDFSKSETLYIETYEKFAEFKKNLDTFKERIASKPNESDFPLQVEKDDLGNVISSSRPGYSSAKEEWESDCKTYMSLCDGIYDEIETKITSLQKINSNLFKLDVLQILGVAGNIVLNEDYHYCMTDSIYEGIQIFGKGGDFQEGACSVTAAATAFSLVLGRQITPIDFNNYGYEHNLAGAGKRYIMFPEAAREMGLKYNIIESGKDTEQIDAMFERIKNKQSVAVLLLTPNSDKDDVYYTANGHYVDIVDARINPDTGEKEFLIWETAYENRRDEREGWHTVEEICSVVHDKNGFTEISATEIPNANEKSWNWYEEW